MYTKWCILYDVYYTMYTIWCILYDVWTPYRFYSRVKLLVELGIRGSVWKKGKLCRFFLITQTKSNFLIKLIPELDNQLDSQLCVCVDYESTDTYDLLTLFFN